jgi:hypothetical protein
MKLKNSGFSLIEAMVAFGLFGIISMAAMSLMNMMDKSQKTSDLFIERSTDALEIKKILSKSKKNISWQFLDFEKMYYLNNISSTALKVEWTEDDIPESVRDKIQFDVNGILVTRNSNSVEIKNVKTGSGVIFSRCIEKEKFNNNILYEDAVAITIVPFTKFVNLTAGQGSSKIEVFCCEEGIEEICNNQVLNEQSQYRVQTFYKKNEINGKTVLFKRYPLQNKYKSVVGAGFFFYVDNNKIPKRYSIVNFIQHDLCVEKKPIENCTRNFKTKYSVMTDWMLKHGLQERGFLDLK